MIVRADQRSPFVTHVSGNAQQLAALTLSEWSILAVNLI